MLRPESPLSGRPLSEQYQFVPYIDLPFLGPDLSYKLVDGRHVDPVGAPRHDKVNAFSPSVPSGDVFFGDIFSHGVRIIPLLLEGDLALSGKQPVDEYFNGVGMGGFVNEAQRTQMLAKSSHNWSWRRPQPALLF